MKYFKLLFCFFIIINISSQSITPNLIPNPSFENHLDLPCNWTLTQEDYFSAMNNWFLPTNGTSDIFSNLVDQSCYASCNSTNVSSMGTQQPRTGDLMSAIFTFGLGVVDNYREYLEVELITPLTVGKTYIAEMYISSFDELHNLGNNVGMYFSDTLIHYSNHSSVLNFIPQINKTEIVGNPLVWQSISDTFVATSPSRYLILGNFFDNESTITYYHNPNYLTYYNVMYFVDDVSVKEYIPSCINAIEDQAICIGETVNISAQSDSLLFWKNIDFPNEIISNQNFLDVSPIETTIYIAFNSCGIDTVKVIVDSDLPQNLLQEDTSICYGQILPLDVSILECDFLWSDSTTNPQFTIFLEGIYWLEATNACGNEIDTLNIDYFELEQLNLGNDTVLCEGSSLLIDLSYINGEYYWFHNDSEDSVMNIDSAGYYYVSINNQCESNGDGLFVSFINNPNYMFGNDTILCKGANLILEFNNMNVNYLWQNNSQNSFFNVTSQGEYWVNVTNQCNTFSDTIKVDFKDVPEFSLGTDSTLCEGSELILDVSNYGNEFLWQDNSENSKFIVLNTGEYWVRVTNECGVFIDSIDINYINDVKFDLGKDSIFCGDIKLNINVGGIDGNYIWQNNSSNHFFEVNQEGNYWLMVSNECFSFSDTINFIKNNCENFTFIMPNIFTPNNDEVNDLFTPIEFPVIMSQLSTMKIYNRWGQVIFETNEILKGWNGKVENQKCSDGIYYYIINLVDENGENFRFANYFTLINY
ncbi:MAG: gliding motility-associated C-terminal domain-containing protein [Bacteroidota bacterium]